MNRREAIQALIALPEVARISVTNLKPNDVIVFECESYVTNEVADRIKELAQGIWPDHKVVVLNRDVKMKVVSG